MSAAVSSHGGSSGPLSLMSCVRESSPPQDFGEYETEKSVSSSKKRFWNPRKWFKRKNNKVADEHIHETVEGKEHRSKSTSELSETEETPIKRSGAHMHPGLSISHDSVFHSPNSGSEAELETAHSSSSLSINQNRHSRLQSELTEKLRLRRGREDTSEDDEGLPRSPCNTPTTTENKTAIKDHPIKSHSTCSEGSLISMGSSEIEEDLSGSQSHHSSRVSLQDKKILEESELETVQNSSYPLNHSAAHHKVAVRPNRRHGAPRRKRGQPLTGTALPTTPEVNEDSSIRSQTPEITTRREIKTELYAKSSRTLTETQLKCSSLPPGLAGPGADQNRLNRSRSNAGNANSQDVFETLGEDDGKDGKLSFIEKLLPIRRSGKKNKKVVAKEETWKVEEKKTETTKTEEVVDSKTVEERRPEERPRLDALPPKPQPHPRTGAAARQRIVPNDIPASPELNVRAERGVEIVKVASPEKNLILSTSPLKFELESRLQQRFGTQPSPIRSPPPSPKLRRSPMMSPKRSPVMARHDEKADVRTKVAIPGLSDFQRKVLSVNENEFSSLYSPGTDQKVARPVAKSHSFKNVAPPADVQQKEKQTELTKANSLDSIKNLEGAAACNENVRDHFVSETVKTDVSRRKESEITISGPSHTAVVEVNSEEIRKELKQTIKREIKQEAMSEMKKEPNQEVKESNLEVNREIKRELNKEIKTELNREIKKELNQEVTKELTEELNQEVRNEVNQEVKREIKQEIKKEETCESRVSITKIQFKKDSTHVMKETSNQVPEFMNVHLHKVEKPSNNVILSTAVKEDHVKENTVDVKEENSEERRSPTPKNDTENCDGKQERIIKQEIIVEPTRRFSKEEIEIVEKHEEREEEKSHVATALVTITTMTPKPFKKPENLPIKKTEVTENAETNQKRDSLKTKSISLDLTEKNDKPDKSEEKRKSLTDVSETEIPRRKSITKRTDDEPELMKVFARRSLKLKDNESEALSQQVTKMIEEETVKSRESDKENRTESPTEERKSAAVPKKETPKVKEPLIEAKFIESAEVTLRKGANNNNKALNQRTVSLSHHPKTDGEKIIKKQYSLNERPKTEWINKPKEEITIVEEIAKSKNFNQRKAEWEKRAQEALKKTTPQ